MFYRDHLERISDPDFQIRLYSEAEEEIWHSRDADFATTDPEQIPENAGEVPLGRLQMGFVLGAEDFKENARKVKLRWDASDFAMLIADPLDLWREKEAAIYRRRRPQDSLHLEVLELTLRWETIHYAEQVKTGEVTFENWQSRLEEVKRRWHSILQNPALIRRLRAQNVPSITEFVSLLSE